MKYLLALALISPPIHPAPILNSAVTQENIGETICAPGWTAGVRPSVRYTDGVKRQMMEAVGIPWSKAGLYELDHIVPLELGGHPFTPGNLQLQLWPEARKKDVVETWLHRMVCKGRIKLADAQSCIYSHWQQCKRSLK